MWLSQKQLTELFGKAKGTISEHIKHIFEDAELEPGAVVRLFRTTAADGKQYTVEHYNLDMVLALGFRVRSPVAVRFRQWAGDKLKEYITKGFVLDDQRLKNPGKGIDYFDELTRRLQDIRTSERRFYQKITDIYATSVDYDPTAQVTQTFFATVQNKVHFAIHGQTAAELITTRANSGLPTMGLTNWDGARIRKTDVSIAKNYLSVDELLALNNLALVPTQEWTRRWTDKDLYAKYGVSASEIEFIEKVVRPMDVTSDLLGDVTVDDSDDEQAQHLANAHPQTRCPLQPRRLHP